MIQRLLLSFALTAVLFVTPVALMTATGRTTGAASISVPYESRKLADLSAGGGDTCGITPKHHVTCWGDDEFGQADTPSGQFRQVTSSWGPCAVTMAGGLRCWGANRKAPRLPSGVRLRAASNNGMCWIRSTGTLLCFSGPDDRLGAYLSYQDPTGQTAFRQMSGSYQSGCGVEIDGSVMCWATGVAKRLSPDAGLFEKVAFGGTFACGLRDDGWLACWGSNLCPGGDFSCGQIHPPTGTFVDVSTAFDSPGACAIRENGALTCWSTVPQQSWAVPSGTFVKVSLGTDDNGLDWGCAQTIAGTVECWGDGQWAQTLPPPSRPFASVSAGASGVTGGGGCVISSGHRAVCWSGDLPNGSLEMPGGSFKSVTTVPDSGGACGLREDESIACWGNTSYGDDLRFTQVSAGFGASCGILISASITCWGALTYPSRLASPPAGAFSQVDVAVNLACAVSVSKHLVCWGNSSHGDTVVPKGKYLQVSVGYGFACAVSTAARLACWGSNGNGKAHPPSGRFLQVTSGYTFACGLRTDHSAVCWGDNRCFDGGDFQDLCGQATAPSGAFRDVSARSESNACGIEMNGSLRCWGDYDIRIPNPGSS